MKRILSIIAIILLVPAMAWAAADSVVVTVNDISTSCREVVFDYTANSTTGAISNVVTNSVANARTGVNDDFDRFIKDWYLYYVITDPGATAPTINTDLYIYDTQSLDVLGGNGVDSVSNTTTGGCVPSVDGQNMAIPIRGTLTQTISGNSENSALIKIIWVLVK